MVSPYASFKATVDAEMPTPGIEWSALPHNPDIHHFYESAFYTALFNGVTYSFVGGCVPAGEGFAWHIDQREGPVHRQSVRRERIVANGATWPEARAAFVTAWEAICETARGEVAARNFGGATIIRSNQDNDARLRGVVARGGAWRLTPAFNEDVDEYLAETSDLRIVVEVAKKFDGQSLSWRAFGAVTTGQTRTLIIPSTSPLPLAITVTSENGEATKTYTFTIQKVA